MKAYSLQFKFRLVLVLLFFILALVASCLVALTESREIKSEVMSTIESKQEFSLKLLSATNSIMLDRVHASMKLLMHRANILGTAVVGNKVSVSGKSTNDLILGEYPQGNNFDLVDSVTHIMGGTATIFARDGDRFVRISTNVINNGQRATGTELSRTGDVYKLIVAGKPYYGKIDILGTPYITGYEPIVDQLGNVVGILYVGYKADIDEIESVFSTEHIMKNGFIGLVDNQSRLRFHSLGDDGLAKRVLSGEQKGWKISSKSFDAWGYQVVTAYPSRDVRMLISSKVFWTVLVIVGASIFIMFIVGLAVERMILSSLKTAVTVAENISNGEFDNDIDISSQDEMGRLLFSLNTMQTVLKHFMQEVFIAVDELQSATGELSVVSEQTLQGVTGQQLQTDSVATAMEEMSANVADVARSAGEAASLTQENKVVTQGGLEVVRQTMTSISLLDRKIQQASENISQLDSSSERIVSVLEVIGSIAEQTNLLALNAAIEAARAGESGRGFAVVASEVRELANRTRESTEEISEIITELRESAKASVSSMYDSRTLANDTSIKAEEALNALDNIANAVGIMTDMNSQIAAAAEQQRAVAEDVNRNVWQIRDIAEQTSDGAKQSNVAMGRLTGLSGTLEALIKTYGQSKVYQAF